MRCLYCGKELALFKRLRGGEFCSDAHRQRYQEEYTQLALNRLAQAGAVKDEEPEPETTSPAANEAPVIEVESPALRRRERVGREAGLENGSSSPAPVTASSSMSPEARISREPLQQQTAVLEAERVDARPAVRPAAQQVATPSVSASAPEEEAAPARMSGFLVELPVPVAVEITAPDVDLELASASELAFPRLGDISADGGQLESAERVSLKPSTFTDYRTPVSERGMDWREFAHGTPPVEFNVKPAGESGFAQARETFEVDFSALPPAEPPQPWLAAEVPFPSQSSEHEILLGDLARLDFELTEWKVESEEPSAAPAIGPSPLEPMRVAPVQHEPAPLAESHLEPMQFEPVHIDPSLMENIATAPRFETPEPVIEELETQQPAEAEAAPETESISASMPETSSLEVSLPEPEPEPEPPAPVHPEPPTAVTKPMPVTLHGLAPARGKPVQVFTASATRTGDLQIPRESGLPLRPTMVLGPAPKPAAMDQSAPAAKPSDKPVEKAADKPAAKSVPIPQKREVTIDAKGRKTEVRKSEVRVLPIQVKERTKTEPIKSEPARPEPIRPESARPEAVKPEAAKPETAKPELVKTQTPEKQPQAEKPAPVEKPAMVRTANSAIERPKETSTPAKTVELPKPAVAREAAAGASKTASLASDPDLLGLPKLSFQQNESFWSKLPIAVRLGGIAAVLALAIGGIVLTSHGTGAPKAAAPAPKEPALIEEPALASTAGWTQDWFKDPRQGRHVDVLRGSLTQRDYRVLFEGQIEQGGLGWVVRANEKSFYVEKLQVVTPGLNPTIALVHFAVINGKEQERVQVPLPLQAHADTTYKVRMDVVGNHFTTYVQDKLMATWEDGQIEAGGVGLYYDNGDSAKLRDSINVIPLRRK